MATYSSATIISLFLIFAAAFVCMTDAGQSCSTPGLCCKNAETCCSEGCCPFESATCCSDKKCCPSTHSECCPNGCCSSNYPVCCSDHCCPTTHGKCCGAGCCSNSYPVCCSGQYCCPSGSYCCGAGMCCSLSNGRRRRGTGIDSNLPHPLLRTTIDEIPSYNEFTTTAVDAELVPEVDGNVIDNRQNEHSVAKRAVTNLGECFNKVRLELNEGKEKCKYLDSKGIPTIGVGFNLQKAGARERITAVGADYDKVLSGEDCLNDVQIEQLLEEDTNTAITCAKTFPVNWSQLHSGAQSAIADMAFNLGCPKLKGFKCLKNALARLDYTWAAKEMRDSDWCGQVKTRCDRNIKCMCNNNVNCINAAGKRQ